MLAKLDDSGNLEAVFTFGATGTATDDVALRYGDGQGAFFIAGNTRSFGVGVQDIFLAKFSASGGLPSLQWLKTYGGSANEEVTGIEVLEDDGLILLSGNTSSFGTNGDGLLIATDTADGNVMLAYSYGSSEYDAISDILPTDDGLAIVGSTQSFSAQSDPYLILLGDAGTTSCNIQAQTITAVDQTSNVSFVGPPTTTPDFTSTTISLSQDASASITVTDVTITTNELCVSIGVDEQNDAGVSLEAYPVPTDNNLTVRLGETDNYQIVITSVDDKIVETRAFTGNRLEMNLESLDSGVYFVSVENGKGITTKRIVKQ